MNAISKVSIAKVPATAVDLALMAQAVWIDVEQAEFGSHKASSLIDHWEGLAEAVRTAPTTSLTDALIQVCYANNLASEIYGIDMPRDDLEEAALKLQRTLFSVIAFLQRHLGVDPEEIARPCANSHMNPFLGGQL